VTPALQIYLMRHGETAWSLSGQHTGRTDLPLTPHGQAMARQLAPMLNSIDFALVLTSPRLRTRATCDASGLGATAELEPDLVEWDYGEYEGLRTGEILARRPGWNVWEDGCPGGEMPTDVGARADRLIARLSHLSGHVALFSHGHFGRVLAARWIGLPLAQGQHFAIDSASISIFGFEKGHPQRRVIRLWNATVGRGVGMGGPGS